MLNRFHCGQVVALVVGATARVNAAVSDRGLERRSFPLIDRICRLHVIVAVDREVWLAWTAVPLGHHPRQPALHDVDDLRPEAPPPEARPPPVRVPRAALGALGQGADGR